MSESIANPHPIRLGHDLEGNPVVARPEPEESLVDFLKRAQAMAEELTELHASPAAARYRSLEETAAQLDAQAKVAGTDPDLIKEYLQNSADCRILAVYLSQWNGDFEPTLRLVRAMDHPERILPSEVWSWFYQTLAPCERGDFQSPGTDAELERANAWPQTPKDAP